MSSTNDIYHHLFVPIQPKSILKKSPSPRIHDSTINFENDFYSNTILSENIDIDKSKINNNSNLSPTERSLTKLIMGSNENLYQYEIDRKLIRTIPPPADLSSDDEQQQQQYQRIKVKPKKTYYRSFVANGTLSSSPSSSDNNDERKAKLSMVPSKITSIRPNKHRPKDMQLDEFMRKYQQQGGIHLPTKEDQLKPINNDYHSFQRNSHINKVSMNDDTISLLESINTIALSSKSLSPLQLLFDVARTNQIDRRLKIDQIRQYVEEQIGISPFLTIYKLIKSSQIPINIQQKPFCYYANFIPHLCCLIMLESEQQRKKIK